MPSKKKIKDYWLDNDDWLECYGNNGPYGNNGFLNTGKSELIMDSGGSHWWNYVISKEGIFIENKNGIRKINKMLVSSPDGNYISEQELDYKLKNMESDIGELFLKELELEHNIVYESDNDDTDEEDDY